jgi:hypothetical protein
MVLTEAATLITFIAENFMTEGQIVDTFDAAMIEASKHDTELQRHVYELLAELRELDVEQEQVVKRLGKYKVSPYLRFSCRLTVEFILELPLNFIPLVGTPLFLLLQGNLWHFDGSAVAKVRGQDTI